MSDFGGINGTQVQTPRASVIAARLKSFLTDNQGSAETDRVMPPGSRDMQDSRQSSKRRSTKEARSDSKEDALVAERAPLAERPGRLRRATVDCAFAQSHNEDAEADVPLVPKMPSIPSKPLTSREPRLSEPRRSSRSSTTDDPSRPVSPILGIGGDPVVEEVILAAPSVPKSSGAAPSHRRNSWRRRSSSSLVLEGEQSFSPDSNANGLVPTAPLEAPAAASRRRVDKRFFDHDTFIFAGSGVLWDVDTSLLGSDQTQGEAEIISMANVYTLLSHGKQVLFVCNTTQHSRRSYVEELRQRGLDIRAEESAAGMRDAEDRIISIGHTCAWYLRSRGVQKPFVFSSQIGLLKDLQADNSFVTHATNAEDGSILDGYAKDPNSKGVADALAATVGTDAVVVDWDKEPTAIKLAVAASHLGEASECGQKIPLVTCCKTDWKRKLRALWDGTMCRSLTGFTDGIRIDVEAEGVSMRWPSREVMRALSASKASGGYGIDLDSAVFISSSLEELEASRQHGLAGMLVVNSLVSKMKLNNLTAQGQARPEWVVQTFAEVTSLIDAPP